MDFNSILFTAFGCLGGAILIYILFKLVVEHTMASLIGILFMYIGVMVYMMGIKL